MTKKETMKKRDVGRNRAELRKSSTQAYLS
jgi:hypothetical protein